MLKYKIFIMLLPFLFMLSFTRNLYANDIDELLESCADCHEKYGNSKNQNVPNIAGISKEFFMESIAEYISNDRPAKKLKDKKKTMKEISKKLSKNDIEALAEYFLKQKFIPFKQSFDVVSAKKGKKIHRKYCDKCHAENGTSSEDDTGILAGQPKAYLRYSLTNYKDDKREMTKKMAKKFKTMLKKTGKESIEHLINFYASQQ